MAEWPKAAVC